MSNVAEYVDIEIEVDVGQGRDYPVRIVRSPVGEARAVMAFPLDMLALESRIKDLQIALLSTGVRLRRQHTSMHEQAVQEFGVEMFTALFSGEVRSRYDMCQEIAAQQGKGLRIKLCVRPPELAVLPWEYLYDTRLGDYLCLSGNTSLVRHLELSQSVQPLAIAPPLRMLAMSVSPSDLAALDANVERQRIERALDTLQTTGLITVDWLEGQTWRDLRNELRKNEWHIFHFHGHGGFDSQRDEGVLALADADGRAHNFAATEFGRLLADHRSLRLVVLNVCEGARGGLNDVFSSTATTLIQRGIPAVVGMQHVISDAAAIEFAHTFYEILISGVPVDVALSEARKAISFEFENSLEWGTPVIYMRSMTESIFAIEPIENVRISQTAEATRALTIFPEVAHHKSRAGMPPFRKGLTAWQITLVVLLVVNSLLLLALVIPRFISDPGFSPQMGTSESATQPTLTPIISMTQQTSNAPMLETVTKTNRIDGAVYVLIPAGEFLMGDDNGEPEERPEHTVYLQQFWMKATAVTNQEYARCYFAGLCKQPNGDWRYALQTYPLQPVSNVTWEQALQYANWVGGRLPTEAEWEKACRGPDGRTFPWGNDLPIGDFGEPIELRKAEAGSRPGLSSPYGVLDLIGNVEEWTSSIWGTDIISPTFGYPYIADDGREQIELAFMRVIRGGMVVRSSDPKPDVHCARRFRDNWFNSNELFGFRVVLDRQFGW